MRSSRHTGLLAADTFGKAHGLGSCDQKGNIGRALEGFAFAEVAVIPQHLPVIRGEDHHPGTSGLFTACLEVPDERGDLLIDVVDQPVIACLGRAQDLALEQHALSLLGHPRG